MECTTAEGRYASISGMAAAERIERGNLGSVLRLTLLAPDIVEAVQDGVSCPPVAQMIRSCTPHRPLGSLSEDVGIRPHCLIQ